MVEWADALSAMRQLLSLSAEDQANCLASDEVTDAALQLTQALDNDGVDVETGQEVRYVLGWWHELVSDHAATEHERNQHQTQASALLLPAYVAGSGRLPPRVGVQLASQAQEMSALAVEMVEGILEGDPTISLVDAVRAAHQAASLTTRDAADVQATLLSTILTGMQSGVETIERALDLDEEILSGREALATIQPEDPPRAGLLLSDLAVALHAQWYRTGQAEDLNEAIRLHMAAVRATPPNDPNRAQVLASLGVAMQSRFQTTKQAHDSDEVIRLHQEAVQALPPDHPNRAGYLASLGYPLFARWYRSGSIEDLDEAVRLFREAVQLTPPNGPNRADVLAGLGMAMQSRFLRTGDIVDGNEAVEVSREVVDATPSDHPDRARHLSTLMLALLSIFRRTGRLDDLDEAIRTGQEAADLTPPDHPDRAGSLSHLGTALVSRFGRTRRVEDLDEGIRVIGEAVELTPSDHPDRAGFLSDLGTALLFRFERAGEVQDLNEAIRLGREAVAATLPDDHLYRGDRLSTLGGTLRIRFIRAGRVEDLDEAVRTCRDAVAATPANHPSRAEYLNNLGGALQLRFEWTGQDADWAGAVDCYREAAESPVAAPATACAAAASWGRLASEDEVVRAFDLALELLPRVSARWLTYEDALAQGRRVSRIGRDAAAAFIAAGDPERALVAVEQAGAFTYSQILQSRSDLTRLRETYPDLAERVGAALAAFNTSPSQLAATEHHAWAGSDSGQVRFARQVIDAGLQATLTQVRDLGGPWARFFLPPLVGDLKRAAAAGPIVVLVVSERRCDALVVTLEDVQLVPLPDLREDDAITSAVRFLVDTEVLSRRGAAADKTAAAHQRMHAMCGWMWDTIAAPIMQHLGHTEPTPGDDYRSWPRVWWIPTGPLAILPIHAAGHHPHTSLRHTHGPALIERVVSSTLPTISSLISSRGRPLNREHRVLLVGMPHTPPLNGQPVPDLPGVSAELAAVGHRLHATPVLSLIEGRTDVSSPTKPAVLSELPRHAWVHLACHARTDPLNPTASTLLLADHSDDPFTVLDLSSAPAAGGDLLFLSACTTARTGATNLDEPVHFAAAALLSGYRHTIATLWPLQDRTAAEIADSIYTDLTTAGHPDPWTADHAAAAVHQAIHDQRATPGTTIYTWASLAHYGP
jgi:tetratricopeptide (TPR) repeat protein